MSFQAEREVLWVICVELKGRLEREGGRRSEKDLLETSINSLGLPNVWMMDVL